MKPNFNLNQVSKAVCDYYGVDESIIQQKVKTKKLALIRQMFFYIAIEFTQKTNLKIGLFAERTHATVLHGSNKVRIEKEIYAEVRNDIEEITVKIYGCGLIPNDVNLLELTENYTKSFI